MWSILQTYLLYRLHGISSFLQLMRSRYQPTSQNMSMMASCTLNSQSRSPTFLHQQLSTFQMEQLEEDFVLMFITGKPLIESPDGLRKVFKFKESQKQDLGNSQT